MSPMEPEDNRWCALRGKHQPPADAGADALWVSPDGGLTMIEVKTRRTQSAEIDHVANERAHRFLGVLSGVVGVTSAVGSAISAWALIGYYGRLAFPLIAVVLAIVITAVRLKLPAFRARILVGITGLTIRTLTGLAAFLAGRQGPAMHAESKSHLAGESGHDPVSWAKVLEAAGFVIAGLRYRGQEWADAAWKPAEFVLRSRFLSGLFIAAPTITVAVEVLTHKGTMTLLTSLGSIFGAWGFLAGMIKAGREYREVKPNPPKRRARADDQDQ